MRSQVLRLRALRAGFEQRDRLGIAFIPVELAGGHEIGPDECPVGRQNLASDSTTTAVPRHCWPERWRLAHLWPILDIAEQLFGFYEPPAVPPSVPLIYPGTKMLGLDQLKFPLSTSDREIRGRMIGFIRANIPSGNGKLPTSKG